MKKLFTLLGALGLFLLLGPSNTAFAQGTIAPTSMYCLGSCPTEAPTNAVPSEEITEEPTDITPEVTEEVPTEVMPTTDPCENEITSAQRWGSWNHHHRRHHGFMGWFFQWLLELLRHLFELLGGNGGNIPTPTPTPTPTPVPTDPCEPTTVPQPTQTEPTEPVEEPTTVLTPTEGVIPTITSVMTPSPTSVGTLTEVKLMPLGDSLTEGDNGGFRTFLWKKLVETDGYKIDFVGSSTAGGSGEGDQDHEGHSGWTINDLDEQIAGWMTTYDPDIITLHIGHNDLGQGDSSAQMTQDLQQLVSHLFEANPDTHLILSNMIVTTVGDNTRRTEYNNSISGLVNDFKAQGRNITFVDMSNVVSLDDLPDGAHPNSEGHSKLADAWYPAIVSIYKQLTGTP